jgi:hypothetical protein
MKPEQEKNYRGGIWVRIGQVQWIGLGFKTEQLEEQLSNQFNRGPSQAYFE